MFTAISSFEILNGMEDEVKQAFINRPGLVEKYEGFVGLDVVFPASYTCKPVGFI
jgi:heme-degrading monooxygenase HmoA